METWASVRLSPCSDASDTRYGAASHFYALGYRTAFMAAKGKVISKSLSSPRSKLQALLISCRLTKTILKETEEVVNVGKIVFSVDSTAVYFFRTTRTATFPSWRTDSQRSTMSSTS